MTTHKTLVIMDFEALGTPAGRAWRVFMGQEAIISFCAGDAR
jgi:hypothetical protein